MDAKVVDSLTRVVHGFEYFFLGLLLEFAWVGDLNGDLNKRNIGSLLGLLWDSELLSESESIGTYVKNFE